MGTVYPVEIKLKEARAFADLTGIQQDLKTVLKFCEQLEEIVVRSPTDFWLQDALTTAALVRYCRCFADGVRMAVPGKILASLPRELKEWHERFKQLRNKHIAHSENPFEENRVGAWLADPIDGRQVQAVAVIHSRLNSLRTHEVEALKDLAAELLARVGDRLETEKARVLECARKLPLDDLYSRPMMPPVDASWDDVGKRRGKA